MQLNEKVSKLPHCTECANVAQQEWAKKWQIQDCVALTKPDEKLDTRVQQGTITQQEYHDDITSMCGCYQGWTGCALQLSGILTVSMPE